jgi:hypothetical protein
LKPKTIKKNGTKAASCWRGTWFREKRNPMFKFALFFLITFNAYAEVSCEKDSECPTNKTAVGIGCVMVHSEAKKGVDCEERCVEKTIVRGICQKSSKAKKGYCANPVRNPLDFNTSDPTVCTYAMSESKVDYIFNL